LIRMNRQIWTFRRPFLKTIKTQSFKIKKKQKVSFLF